MPEPLGQDVVVCLEVIRLRTMPLDVSHTGEPDAFEHGTGF